MCQSHSQFRMLDLRLFLDATLKSLQRPLLDTFINGRKHTQVSPHSQYDHITLIHYMRGQKFRLTVKFINRLSCFDVSYQYVVESHEQGPMQFTLNIGEEILLFTMLDDRWQFNDGLRRGVKQTEWILVYPDYRRPVTLLWG